MVAGGCLFALAFVVSGMLELRLRPTYERVPGAEQAHLHLMVAGDVDCGAGGGGGGAGLVEAVLARQAEGGELARARRRTVRPGSERELIGTSVANGMFL